MKIINLFVGVLVFAGQAFAADALTERLQRGLFEEEASRNLDAAIKEYQSVVTQSDEQRKVIATALFRLGECYRKLGRTNEAVAQFRRVVTDFSDQEALVKLSQPWVPSTANPGRSGAADAETARELSQRYAQAVGQLAELNSRTEAINKLSHEDLLVTAPGLFKDEVLSELGKKQRASRDRVREFNAAGRE